MVSLACAQAKKSTTTQIAHCNWISIADAAASNCLSDTLREAHRVRIAFTLSLC